MSNTAFDCPTNRQARPEPLIARDSKGEVVPLDPGAIHITVNFGDGTSEVNDATNEFVFRPQDASVAPTEYQVDVDGEPGPGESFLPLLFTMTPVPAIPEGAVSLDPPVVKIETKGTPA